MNCPGCLKKLPANVVQCECGFAVKPVSAAGKSGGVTRPSFRNLEGASGRRRAIQIEVPTAISGLVRGLSFVVACICLAEIPIGIIMLADEPGPMRVQGARIGALVVYRLLIICGCLLISEIARILPRVEAYLENGVRRLH